MEWVAWLVFFLGVGLGAWEVGLLIKTHRLKGALELSQQRQLDSVDEIARLGGQWCKLIAETEAERELLSSLASEFKAAIEQLPEEARMAIRVMPKIRAGLDNTAQCPMCGAVVPMPGGIRKEN